MSTTLIALNEDLARLRREGYTVEVLRGAGTHLLVHDVPYVNSQIQVCSGTLYAPLELNGERTINPVVNHQTWFIGEHPCNSDGSTLTDVQHQSVTESKGDNITVNHSFSVKPRNNVPYKDYYEKFVRYINLISAPATAIEPGVTARVYKPVPEEFDDSVFHYSNTATSRAGIASASEKLAMKRVAIVGLGGTGSYVLDAIAKTPVREIHLFDGDRFIQHNAFRSPGAPGLGDLTAPMKVEYFGNVYSKMHRHIIQHPYYLDDVSVHELTDFDFVFICVDRGSVRKIITDALHTLRVPYIDTGIGVHKGNGDQLGGQVRVTLGTPDRHDHLPDRASLADRPEGEDLYSTNIQIAELNALSALMAVVRWKKFCGFYVDDGCEYHAIYSVATGTITRMNLA